MAHKIGERAGRLPPPGNTRRRERHSANAERRQLVPVSSRPRAGSSLTRPRRSKRERRRKERTAGCFNSIGDGCWVYKSTSTDFLPAFILVRQARRSARPYPAKGLDEGLLREESQEPNTSGRPGAAPTPSRRPAHRRLQEVCTVSRATGCAAGRPGRHSSRRTTSLSCRAPEAPSAGDNVRDTRAVFPAR